MSAGNNSPLAKQVFEVSAATLLVAGAPVALVWWLRSSGNLTSPLLGVGVGMCVSLTVSLLGRLLWERRPGAEDLLFSELMVWGFVHRLRSQRRLENARRLVGPLSERERAALDEIGLKERAKLLEELVSSMETRDPYLHGHSRRVARHSWMIAKRMGLPRAEVDRVRLAAALHDVGKTWTPKAILHKAGALSDEEYEVIKLHPGQGALMVSVLHDEQLAAIVRHHHERLDGSGYPAGLSGEEIPLGARIVAVADTFDAITSARPYRAASPHRRAMLILRAEAGTRLDADVVKAFEGHYAGRGPLALWSLLAGLPQRVVEWLGGSVAGLATAAKVVALTALVGGVAGSSAGLAVSARSSRQRPHLSASASAASLVGARASGAASILTPGAGSSGHRGRSGPTRGAGGHRRRPASKRSFGNANGSSGTGASGPSGASGAPAAAEGGAGGGAERHQPPGEEVPSGDHPGESSPREAPKGGQEAPKGHEPSKGGKSEETPAKGGGGRSEEKTAAKEEKAVGREETPTAKEEKPQEQPAAREEHAPTGETPATSHGEGAPGEKAGKGGE